MSSARNAHPVWAGVAVRLSDGTLWVVEVDREIQASITVDRDIHEDWGGRLIPGIETVEISVSGRLGQGTRWSDVARQDAPAETHALPAALPALDAEVTP